MDWTKAKGHTLSGTRNSYYPEGESANHGSAPQKLGGQASVFSNARASSVAAAYHRLSNASNGVLRTPEIHEGSESGSSGFTICQDYNHRHIKGETEKSLTYTGAVQKILPVNDTPHYELEPDPDSDIGEAMESEHCIHPSGDGNHDSRSDHSEGIVVPILMKGRPVAGPESLGATERLKDLNELKAASLEPDPDDSGLSENVVYCKNILKSDCDKSSIVKDEIQHSLLAPSSYREPALDDAQEHGFLQSEADPNGDIIVCAKNMSIDEADEPDQDNMELERIQDPVTAICDRLRKVIDMLRCELNPSAATSILHIIIRILQ